MSGAFNRRLAAAAWFLRLALAVTLLSAVADRFGLWGPPGSPNASWGDWRHFVAYCARLNHILPAPWATPLAWISTILECACAAGLITGVWLRWTAYASFLLLASFASTMTISLGVKAPLNFSVFVDAAAALLLAVLLETRSRLQ